MDYLSPDNLRETISKSKEFLAYQNEVTLECPVSFLTITDLHDLKIAVIENIEGDKEKSQFEKELISYGESEVGEQLSFLKTTHTEIIGDTFKIDYLDQYMAINYRVIDQCLLKMNLGKIPANTPYTFIKTFNENTPLHFSMFGVSDFDILPEQIAYKERVNWERAQDFSFLSGPGFLIEANTPNKQAILKALIMLHKERSGEMFSSSDVFEKAKIDAYQLKLTKFLDKNPVFRKILIKTGRGNQYWKLNIPLNI